MTDALTLRTLSSADRLVRCDASAAALTWNDVFRAAFGPRARTVLDVGSGDGDAASALDAMGHFVHAAASDADAVRRARRAADLRCSPIVFDVMAPDDLRFPAGAFDGVHARGLFATTPRPGMVLLEWFRVLRRGGTALVAESDPRIDPERLLRDAGFVDVRARRARLPGRCPLRDEPRGAWRRLLTPRRGAFHFAWGRRP